MKKVLFISLLCALVGCFDLDLPTSGIFVDSVNGSDTADGSIDDPVRTLTKAAAMASEGSTIYLAKGSHWRESLDLSTLDSVTVQGWGYGRRPKVDASDVITSAWTLNSGVYETSFAPDGDGGTGVHRLSVYEDDEPMIRAVDLAACASTPGSYYAPTTIDGTGPYTISIHTSGSDDPNTNGSVYEAASRDFAIAIGDHGVVRGVVCKRNLNTSGTVVAGENVLLEDLLLIDGNWHHVVFKSGTLRRVDCWRAINAGPYPAATNTGAALTAFDSAGGYGVDIIDCVLVMSNLDPADTSVSQGDQAYDEFNSHDGTWSHYRFDGMVAIRCRTGGGNVALSSYYNCVWAQCVGTGKGVSVGDYIGNRVYAHETGYDFTPGCSLSGTATCEDNWFYMKRNTGACVLVSSGHPLVRNNVLAGVSGSNVRGVQAIAAGSSIIIDNLVTANQALLFGVSRAPVLADWNSYNNAAWWKVNNTTYTTLATLQAAGYELNGDTTSFGFTDNSSSVSDEAIGILTINTASAPVLAGRGPREIANPTNIDPDYWAAIFASDS